jgi:hypothetical protein
MTGFCANGLCKSSGHSLPDNNNEEGMRIEFPQLNTKPVESGRSSDQKVPVYRNNSTSIKNSEIDDKSSAVMLGLGGTYSLASLKAAAEHQSKFSTVAENNILAANSVSSIPEGLLQMFNAV